MPRSTLRCALGAGALCLTASIAAPAVADAAPLKIGAKRLNIQAGKRALVKGRVEAPATVRLQIRRHDRWVTIDRDRSDAAGRFVLRGRVRSATSTRARVRTSTGLKRSLGRLNAFRHAQASWYGPGLYGNHLGCGGRLNMGTVGVANKSLPCGAKVTIRHRGRLVRVKVIDRGPYVGGREYDLTAATARKLRFSGAGAIQVTR
jgi:rare lipoprotein A (peptidoglycan hydrolase)